MRCHAVARPLIARHFTPQRFLLPYRSFTTTSCYRNASVTSSSTPSSTPSSETAPPPTAAATTTTPVAPTDPLDLDPNTVLPQHEASLIKAGKMPIGSRRRRVAMRTTATALEFEQLPYQAFQEARKILAADRADKVSRIEKQLARIELLQARPAEEFKNGGEEMKKTRIASLRRSIDELKILADANDPVVRKRFEDGLGDMNKPIYRHYAHEKWLSYDQRLITQRISQFSIVPDILPALQPSADVKLLFRGRSVPPGQIVPSLISENPPHLKVQVFNPGQRLVTIAVLDADVPDFATDSFSKRCHFLAANVPLSPTDGSIPLSKIRDEGQLAVPWLPAFSQKGSPYHRLAIFLLEQKTPNNEPIDVNRLKELYSSRENFSLKSLRDKFSLEAFGFTLFRSEWDENTATVMGRHGIPGADVELRPARVHSLKGPVKARGWEAKRQGPKYRHLWKYTKRIKGYSNARGLIRK